MINFITYGDENYYNSKKILTESAKKTNWFNTINSYGHEDLDNCFKEKYKFILNKRKGGGYWIWKPYIIKKKLSEMNDNDILVYLDAGCTINQSGKKRFDEYIEMLNKSNKCIISFQMCHHMEKIWTTKEIFKYFNLNLNLNINIANTGQLIGTILIIKKTTTSVEMINRWNNVLIKNPLLFTDYYNKIQLPYFKDNRHDQSVFSVLRKIYGDYNIILKDETYFTPFGNNESINYPFWATRIKK